MKKYVILLLALALLVGGTLLVLYLSQISTSVTATATQKVIYNRASTDDIVVASPKPGDILGSIIDVRGRARGGWYFEASFPIEVLDADGRVIGQGVATAQGDWMTKEFVPFSATVTLTQSYTGSATLVLKKDNPSGESSRDASMFIPLMIQ